MNEALAGVLRFLADALAALTPIVAAHPYAIGLPILFGPALFALLSTRNFGVAVGMLILNAVAAMVIAADAPAGALAYLGLWVLAILLGVIAHRRAHAARHSPTRGLRIDDDMIGRHG